MGEDSSRPAWLDATRAWQKPRVELLHPVGEPTGLYRWFETCYSGSSRPRGLQRCPLERLFNGLSDAVLRRLVSPANLYSVDVDGAGDAAGEKNIVIVAAVLV